MPRTGHRFGRSSGQCLDPPDQGVNSGHQIGAGNRLGEVIVGPESQPADPVVILVALGQEDNRGRLSLLPERQAQLKPGLEVAAERDI